MANLKIINDEINNLSESEIAILNEFLTPLLSNGVSDEKPVDMVKKAFKHAYQGTINDSCKNIMMTLLSEPGYFIMLANACKHSWCIDQCSPLSNDDKKEDNIDYLELFYKGLVDYASNQSIPLYPVDDCYDNLLHIKYNGTTLSLAHYRYGNGVCCKISEPFELEEDGEKTVSFDDIMDYYKRLIKSENPQRVNAKSYESK